ncbi:MAG TPA: DUF2723 domain-containing protein [bacterium]|nr:DUF2723 domain-containing protein [bacterium]
MDDDSAETITAGTLLGIQHPPGYALDTLWVRLFAFLPLGGAAFRVNLGSAFLGALGVFLFFLLSRRVLGFLDPGKAGSLRIWILPASLFASFCLGFSHTQWEKALGAKGGIYLIQEVLLLGILYVRLSVPGPKGFLLACLLSGMGLANHWETQVLFLPLLAVFFWPLGPADRTALPKEWAPYGPPFLFLGLSPLLLLPLRAHLDPLPDLGHPDHWDRFLKCIFRGYTFGREPGLLGSLWDIARGTGSWAVLGSVWTRIWKEQVSYIPVHFWNNPGPLALAFGVLAILGAGRAGARKILVLVFLPLVPLLAVFTVALWVPLNVPHAWLMDNYLLPADALVCLLAAMGLGILDRLKEGPTKPHILWFFALLVLFNGATAYRLMNETKQTLRYDYGTNLLRSLPKASLFFAEGDEDYFPLYYLQLVEGRRPDVRMIPSFTLFETWGWDQLERSHPELGLGSREGVPDDPYHRIETALGRLVSKGRDRIPIGYSYFSGAFHHYYLQGQGTAKALPSGNLLLLETRALQGVDLLAPGGLRLRHFTDCPSNAHPSLTGIWRVYRAVGVAP